MRTRDRVFRPVLSLLVSWWASSAVLAQDVGESDPAPVLDPLALEAFVDGYMLAYLEEKNIVGASVVFVEGEDVVLEKGYGFADLERRSPVEPSTLFRIGSVSKLFVWTAVMQLVESGQIDLNADVNTYLSALAVPEGFDAPVTMADLMTHSAGFDERVLGLFSDDVGALRPLEDILRDELPARVRPPREVISYSNHGTGLAMHVVEAVTGSSWDAVIQERILEPLGMETTTFGQPLPFELDALMSKGYRLEGGTAVMADYELVPLASVGAAAASASEMSRFLIAHLRLGAYGPARILEEETARQMQSTLFRHQDDVNGMAHGFMELDRRGIRIVGHGGDTVLFHTLFAIFPDHGIGVFASFNTVGANYSRFLDAFVEWRFPSAEPSVSAAGRGSGLGRFAGTYRPTRFPQRTFAKVSALASSFEVVAEDGALVVAGARKRRFLPAGPLLFHEEGKPVSIAFREDDDGEMSRLFFSDVPVIAFERAPLTERPKLVNAVLGLSAAIVVLGVLFWPLARWARWHYGASLFPEARIPATGRWTAWLGSLLLTVFTIGFGVMVSDPMQVVYGLSENIRWIFYLPMAAAVLAAVAGVAALWSWRSQRGTLVGRIAFSLLVVAMAALLWQLSVWNLFSFQPPLAI